MAKLVVCSLAVLILAHAVSDYFLTIVLFGADQSQPSLCLDGIHLYELQSLKNNT
jgi:hypothetical protein